MLICSALYFTMVFICWIWNQNFHFVYFIILFITSKILLCCWLKEIYATEVMNVASFSFKKIRLFFRIPKYFSVLVYYISLSRKVRYFCHHCLDELASIFPLLSVAPRRIPNILISFVHLKKPRIT